MLARVSHTDKVKGHRDHQVYKEGGWDNVLYHLVATNIRITIDSLDFVHVNVCAMIISKQHIICMFLLSETESTRCAE